MNTKNETVLLSGVTGQCGSYLAEMLLEKGYKVIGIKRRTSLLNAHERVETFYGHENFKLVYGNVTDASNIWTLVNTYKPAYFINAAAQSHVKVSFDVTEETFDVVAKAPLIILNAIKELSPNTKFIQFSSSEMYGTSPCPLDGYTEDSIMLPASPYAIAKLAAYHLVRNYRNSYGLHASNAIFFNMESPRRGETFFPRKVSMAVARIKTGVQDKLYVGNLEAKRDWGYVPEYMNGILLMMNQETPDDYLFATGETHSCKEYLDKTFKLAGIKTEEHVEIDSRLFRPEEVPYLLGNATKAKIKLGWDLKVRFDELVELMYQHEIENILR